MKAPRFRAGRFPARVLSCVWIAALLFGWTGRAAGVERVVVVFKTHFDLGYTDMASNVVQRYRTSMIDDALKVVDQNRDLPPEQQFVWTLAGWPLAKILEDWPGQTPGRQRRIREAFQQGRFVTHALPFTTHTGLLELEDLVRGLGYASRLSREAGLPLPRDAKMTDVPSHSWILPTLLRQAGVDFLHLGCNAASSSPRVPRLFWWEGPDGSRLLTMYTAESYGTGLVPPPDWPYKTWLALIHTGDNHGPPRPDEVKKLLDEAKTTLPGVEVRIGRLSDFSDAILAGKPDIPVVRGDMPDTWIHGPMSDPAGASLARTIRPEIAAGEALNTLLALWGVKPPPLADVVGRAYESSLLYGEHTWGGAYWWIYGNYHAHYGDQWQAERQAGRFERIESSWEEHTAYIREAARLTAPRLADELARLARSVNFGGPRIVVFNPLPFQRGGPVTVRPGIPGITALNVAPVGLPIPVEHHPDGAMSFFAPDVPALGYRTLVPARVSPSAAPGLVSDPAARVLESPFFRATLDARRFVLTSLVDRRSGRELVDPAAPHGFGQYVYERFSANEVGAFVRAYVKIDAEWGTNELGKPMLPPATTTPYQRSSPVDFEVRFACTALGATATAVSPKAPGLRGPLRARITLDAHQPFIELEYDLDKPAEPWPEAGWIALPFAVGEPRFRLARLGSIVDPASDLVDGANRHLFALNGGLTVTGPDGAGAGVVALDSPLVSLGEPGCWKYSVTDFPRTSSVYVNLFNNQWTTNFRLWTEGSWRARLRIWSVTATNTPADSLAAGSLEARAPLMAAVADGPPGALPRESRGLGLSRPGIQVTAFGPNPDGPGTILRLWELAGESGDCVVTLPAGSTATSAQPVDLRGQPRGMAIPVQNGGFTVPVKAFAPVSVVLPSA